MRNLLGSSILLLSCALSLAIPTEPPSGLRIPLTKRRSLVDEDGVISSDALQNEVNILTMKLHRGLEAFERNTGYLHPKDNIENGKRAKGADPLKEIQDGSLWQGDVFVGTPPRRFTVDFDTGSSDLLLPGEDCTVDCQGHKRYKPSKSRTAVDLNKNFTISFGDGSTVQGNQFLDTVTIAGLTAECQTLGSATQYSLGFAKSEFPPDGLMGLAFPSVSVFPSSPFFQTLISQGKTTKPEFSVKLSQEGSELFLGGTDEKLGTGVTAFSNVTDVAFWQVNMDSVDVNGTVAVQGLSAIIDTGTTLIIGDPTTVAQFYAAIPGSKNASESVGNGHFTVPCDTIPEVSLTFGGISFSIPPDEFNRGRVSKESLDCIGGISAKNLGDFWVIGDLFLQTVLTTFDVGNLRVGFAQLAPTTAETDLRDSMLLSQTN
ncbi:acid protease [Pluteus cervinus]|uniref:Acid protease n=1 Tax=Pluteus cervinus TaxID=181527 RepID=A0ACD3BEW7_9AGAR|nr:acid protease [Pluteus cervinus]